ncbi:hypothetical protein K3495_g13455 [Podosphaera aphanis]|nr:hypothetical protein K3495_g13455 [Podosphaera aphanis]
MDPAEARIAAHQLKGLNILRPNFVQRLPSEHLDAINWIVLNWSLSSSPIGIDASDKEKTDFAKRFAPPNGWMNNYAPPLEVAAKVWETLPEIKRDIKGKNLAIFMSEAPASRT